jgi:hypothetical protein
MRVHPAGGQQVMEDLFDSVSNLSDEEDKEQRMQIMQEMKDPSFWESQQLNQTTFNSDELKEWYRKRGFDIDDPDGKHLWHNI